MRNMKKKWIAGTLLFGILLLCGVPKVIDAIEFRKGQAQVYRYMQALLDYNVNLHMTEFQLKCYDSVKTTVYTILGETMTDELICTLQSISKNSYVKNTHECERTGNYGIFHIMFEDGKGSNFLLEYDHDYNDVRIITMREAIEPYSINFAIHDETLSALLAEYMEELERLDLQNLMEMRFSQNESAECAANKFVYEIYPTYLKNSVSEENKVSEYAVTDWGIDFILDESVAVLGWIEYMVVPAEDTHDGIELEYGIKEYRKFRLAQWDDYWYCKSIGIDKGREMEGDDAI